MANLMFKMGNYAGLDAAQKKAGTIYVTKDQHSMYVDISDTERIKIQGTVVAYDNLKDFGESVQPPYDKSVVYFIADKDALVRWNDTDKVWVRLNTPQSDLQAVINRVSAAEDSIAKINEAIGNDTTEGSILYRVKTVEGQASQNAADIILANSAIEALEKALNDDGGLNARMTDAEGRLDTAEGAIDVLEDDVAGLSERIGTAESDIDALQNADTALNSRLGTAEGDIDALEGRMGTAEGDIDALEGRMGTAEGKISVLEDSVAGLDERIGANAGEITAIKNNLTNIDGTVTTHGGQLTTLNNDLKAVDDRVTAIEEELPTVKGDVKTLQDQAANLREDVDKANAAAGTNATSITNLGVTVKANSDAIKANSDAIGADETAGTVKGRIKALETSINDSTTGLAARVGLAENSIVDLQEAINAENTGLDARVTAVTNAAAKNAEDIGKNAENIGKNATAIGENKAAAEKNATDITALDGRVSVNEEAITNINEAIEVIEELLGNGAESGDTGSIATRLSTVENTASQNATAIGNLFTALDGVKSTADTNKADITALDGRVDVNEEAIADIKENYALKSEVEQVEADLTASINDKIRAANSMTYKTKIDSYNDLPIADVKIGDTYIVAVGFSVGEGDDAVHYRPGDLVVASGSEDTNGIITEGLTWNLVETGFNPDLDPVLETNGDQVVLTGATGKPLGAINFVSANDCLTVAVSENTVTFDMVWGEF